MRNFYINILMFVINKTFEFLFSNYFDNLKLSRPKPQIII